MYHPENAEYRNKALRMLRSRRVWTLFHLPGRCQTAPWCEDRELHHWVPAPSVSWVPSDPSAGELILHPGSTRAGGGLSVDVLFPEALCCCCFSLGDGTFGFFKV